MKPPTRLLESYDTDSELRDALDAMRADGLGRVRRDRIGAHLVALARTGGGSSPGSEVSGAVDGATGSVAAKTAAGSAAWKGAALVALVGTVAAVGYVGYGAMGPHGAPTEDGASHARAVSAERPSEHVGARTTGAPEDEAGEELPAASVDDRARREPRGRSVEQEVRLIGRARGLLADDPSGALAVLAQHRRWFPRGTLSEERSVLEIDALSRLGRRAEAERRGRRFLATRPGSLHARRVAAILDERQ